MVQRNIVPPSVIPLTVEDCRELLAPALRETCSDYGPLAVARAIGCDTDKTVRDARDEKATLRFDFAANLLSLVPTAFDPFLARVNRRSVPMGALCDTDALPAMTGVVHRLASGDRSHLALLNAEADIRSAFDALGGLLRQIDVLKGQAA